MGRGLFAALNSSQAVQREALKDQEAPKQEGSTSQLIDESGYRVDIVTLTNFRTIRISVNRSTKLHGDTQDPSKTLPLTTRHMAGGQCKEFH
jgi:hypothetical protein